jgi:hypothetical protein
MRKVCLSQGIFQKQFGGGRGRTLLELFYFNSAFGICEEDFCVISVAQNAKGHK